MGKRKRMRRSFTPEFKAEAVKVVRQSEKSVAMVARDLDLTETALRRWVEQAAVDAGRGGGALTTDERTELVQLRRENRTLRMERDILKNRPGGQAPTCWTRNSGRGTRGGSPGGETDRFLAPASPLKNMVQGLLRT